MNRSIAALLVCTVFLLGTHGINAFEYDSSLTQLLEKAEQGDTDAQFELAERLRFGGPTAASPDSQSEAAKWYRLVAEQGIGYAEAQFQLGRMYEYGEGVAKDICEAFKWYRKAAKGEHIGGLLNLGLLYQNVEVVDCKVAKWKRRAAEQGDDAVLYELGWQYFAGIGIATNRQEAAKWWRLAAEQGHADAQFYLGWMYDQGIEFAEDDCEAGRWYWMAITNEEHTDARANLVRMWYDYNDKGVAIPNCEPLDFVKYPL